MKHVMRILLASILLYYLAGGFFGPLYAVFVEDIGGDLFTAGSAYALFSITSGVMLLLISRWEDHVKHQEKLFVLSNVFACAGFFGYLVVTTPWEMFLVQVIFGIEFAVGAPAFDSLYSRSLDRGRYASEWGTFESTRMAVIGVAAVAGGAMADMYGFRVLFGAMFVASLASLLCSLLLFRNGDRAWAPAL
jgi:MFS family permease